jgi:hypothetical protein
MGMGGRHHCLSLPDQEPGRAEAEAPGGAQEAAEESIAATESGAASTTTVKLPRALMARLEQGSKWQMSEVLCRAFPVDTAIMLRELECIQWSP